MVVRLRTLLNELDHRTLATPKTHPLRSTKIQIQETETHTTYPPVQNVAESKDVVTANGPVPLAFVAAALLSVLMVHSPREVGVTDTSSTALRNCTGKYKI